MTKKIIEQKLFILIKAFHPVNFVILGEFFLPNEIW